MNNCIFIPVLFKIVKIGNRLNNGGMLWKTAIHHDQELKAGNKIRYHVKPQ